MIFRTASRFTAGSVPGWPIHTGQTFAFGRGSSGSFGESQNILVRVFNSACTSKPIVGSSFILLLRSSYGRTSCGLNATTPHLRNLLAAVGPEAVPGPRGDLAA